MKRTIIKENHYGQDVWTHIEMDNLRKTECLCRLCELKNSGYCKNANRLFEVCQSGGIALTVTRCGDFVGEEHHEND